MTHSHEEAPGIELENLSASPFDGWTTPPTPAPKSLPAWLPKVVIAGVAVLGLAAAFGSGYFLKDDRKAERDELRARVMRLTGERNTANTELRDAEQVISSCRDVVRGYGKHVSSADAWNEKWLELILIADEWSMAEPGSTAETDAQARMEELGDSLDKEWDVLQQQVGALRSQANGCLDEGGAEDAQFGSFETQ